MSNKSLFLYPRKSKKTSTNYSMRLFIQKAWEMIGEEGRKEKISKYIFIPFTRLLDRE